MIWRRTFEFARWHIYLATMLFSLMAEGLKPSTWSYPVRDRLRRQILFSGVEAVPFMIIVGILVGGSVFLQCLVWLRFTGQTEFLARMVSALLIREAAPFLASFIVIAASASAMTTELATMKISGQVAMLEAQGINLFRFLAVPRMLGSGIAVLGLSIFFCAVAMLTSSIGFFLVSDQVQGTFFRDVLNSLGGIDFLMLVGKSFLPGICTGAICCYEGLRVTGTSTEIPKAVSAAMLRAVSVSVFIWALILVLSFI